MLATLGEYQGVTYFLSVLPSMDSPLAVVPGRSCFRLVVFLDDSQIPSIETLAGFVSNALNAGARSVLCGGSAAEKVHDTFDEEIVYQSEVLKSQLCDLDNGAVIPTTWFTDAPVDEVLWNAQVYRCDTFQDDNPAAVVVLLQGDHRIAEVERIGRSLPGSLDAVVDRE